MKAKLAFLLIILTLTIVSLPAENDEWGGWFKDNMAKSKEYPMEPEDKSHNMDRWRRSKDEMIKKYKAHLDTKTLHYPEQNISVETRSDIVSSYYYDDNDPEFEKVLDFMIFVVENESENRIRNIAIDNLILMGLCGNNKAKNYILSQKNNHTWEHSLIIQFHLGALVIDEDRQSLDYLMNIVKQAQKIETTDLKFNSPNESIIAGYLSRKFFSRRYSKGLSYEYALPLLRQLIYSRSKNVQMSAILTYYHQTNRAEMRRIYEECMAKVEDKTTPREEFLNALYGLQALYSLSTRNIGKYKIGFKGITSYFVKLGGLVMIDGEWQWKASDSEPRLSAEENRYFQKRLRSK